MLAAPVSCPALVGPWGAKRVDADTPTSVIQLPNEAVESPPEEAQEPPASDEEPAAPIPRDPSVAVASTLPPPRRNSAPPVLASESLRREMAPAEPGRRLLWVIAFVTYLAGAGVSLWLGGLAEQAIAVAVAFVALLALALAPMPYTSRAGVLAVLAGSGVLAATWLHSEASGDPHTVGLTGAVLLLGTALHLRAWHRGSVSARVLVALGLGAGAAWLGAEAPWESLSALPPDLRLSAARVLPVGLGLLLMMSLLAFMDSRTTGGCDLWALGLWLWHVSFAGAEFAAHSVLEPQWAEVAPEVTLSLIAAPLLLPTFGITLAQLLASALSGLADGQTTPSPPPSATPADDPDP